MSRASKHLAEVDLVHLKAELERRIEVSRLHTPSFYRLVITLLLVETGVRGDEAIELKVEDILFDRQVVNITRAAKGSNSRPLGLSEKLTGYLRLLAKPLKPTSYLAETLIGFPNKPNAQSVKQSIRRMWAELMSEIFGDRYQHLTPHAARHSIAVALLENGVAVNKVQLILGHKSLSSTGHYLDYLNQQEVAVVTQHLLFNRKTA